MLALKKKPKKPKKKKKTEKKNPLQLYPVQAGIFQRFARLALLRHLRLIGFSNFSTDT